jgi:hypothetical protein
MQKFFNFSKRKPPKTLEVLNYEEKKNLSTNGMLAGEAPNTDPWGRGSNSEIPYRQLAHTDDAASSRCIWQKGKKQ